MAPNGLEIRCNLLTKNLYRKGMIEMMVEIKLKNETLKGEVVKELGSNVYVQVGNDVLKFHKDQVQVIEATEAVKVVHECAIESALNEVAKELVGVELDGYQHNDLIAEGKSVTVHMLVNEADNGLTYSLWVECKHKMSSNEQKIKDGELDEDDWNEGVVRYETERKSVRGAINFFKRHLHI